MDEKDVTDNDKALQEERKSAAVRRKGYIIQSLMGGIDQWFSTRDIRAPRNICQYLETFLMSPLGGGEEKD